jgi:hypothetical protein
VLKVTLVQPLSARKHLLIAFSAKRGRKIPFVVFTLFAEIACKKRLPSREGGQSPGESGLGGILFNSFHFDNFGIEFLDHLHKLLVFLAIFKQTLIRFISKIGYFFSDYLYFIMEKFQPFTKSPELRP